MGSEVTRLARALAACAQGMRRAEPGSRWDDEAVQLAVVGVYGARLLAQRAGVGFDRASVLELLSARHRVLHATASAALAPDAPTEVAAAVGEMLVLLRDEVDSSETLRGWELRTVYEPFLQTFSPAQRRERGVYYTPPELAAYAVRRVDEVLEHELGVAGGLAATSGEFLPHVLDPAAGDGVFLCAVIAFVQEKVTGALRARGLDEAAVQRGWQTHVRTALLPRLSGVELMPAAHALACLQVHLALSASGYELSDTDRIDLHCADSIELLASAHGHGMPALSPGSHAAACASLLRANVVVGNPPYARRGAPRNPFWEASLARYKEPVRAEKNRQPLADDYLRFLRLTEHLLEGAERGVAALVVNSTVLHGHLHSGVRASLSQTFPRIDALDLGGSTKRKSRDAGRERDENLFPIAQGVALLLMRRTPEPVQQCLRYAAIGGTRARKLCALASLCDDDYVELPLGVPDAPLVPRRAVPPEYAGFVPLDELFDWHSIAAKPGDDGLLVAFEGDDLAQRLEAFRRAARAIPGVARTETARRVRDFDGAFTCAKVMRYAYRPFDERLVYDEPELWSRPVRRLRERVNGQRVLLAARFSHDAPFAHIFVTRRLPDVILLSNKSAVNCFAFPEAALRTEAFRAAGFDEVERSQLLGYVYAVLHSTTYRARYAPGLERGFPRIPAPRDRELFEALAVHGQRLLDVHLGVADLSGTAAPTWSAEGTSPMRASLLGSDPTERMPGAGLVVPVGPNAAFTGVAPQAWRHRIGGYQVCHKWLLDRARVGRSLVPAEVERFQQLVRSVTLSQRIVDELDRVVAAHDGPFGASAAQARSGAQSAR